MKIGLEVEGRLKGIQTLFVDYGSDLVVAYNVCKERHISHLYVRTILLDSNVVLDLANAPNWLYITVECDEINFDMSTTNINHVMLFIKNEASINSIWKLRQTDSYKFVRYDNLVFSSSIESMIVTHPSDFLNDVEI